MTRRTNRLVGFALAGAVLLPAAAFGTSTKVVELKASMNGRKEVPKGDLKATGRGQLKLNTVSGRVCWEFKLSGVAGPAAAHVHKARAGVAGPVVIPLGKAFRREGCTTASVSLIRAIVARPGAYYLNVHTGKYPAGSVRGQLVRDEKDDSGYSGYGREGYGS